MKCSLFPFFVGYSLWGVFWVGFGLQSLTVLLGSGQVGSDDLGYGPGSGFSFEPVQTSILVSGRWMAGGLLVVFAGFHSFRPRLQPHYCCFAGHSQKPSIRHELSVFASSSFTLSPLSVSIPAHCSLLHPSQPNTQNGKLIDLILHHVSISLVMVKWPPPIYCAPLCYSNKLSTH